MVRNERKFGNALDFPQAAPIQGVADHHDKNDLMSTLLKDSYQVKVAYGSDGALQIAS